MARDVKDVIGVLMRVIDGGEISQDEVAELATKRYSVNLQDEEASEPYVRTTYGVRVVIRHDSRTERGFRVFTAFPINEDSKR